MEMNEIKLTGQAMALVSQYLLAAHYDTTLGDLAVTYANLVSLESELLKYISENQNELELADFALDLCDVGIQGIAKIFKQNTEMAS